MDLKGKNALVTGGSRRIGRSIALALARAGANVAIHCRRESDEAEETARAIGELGCRCAIGTHDLAAAERTESWFRQFQKDFGGFDILINSASEYAEDSYTHLNPANLERSMAIHVLSPVAMINAMGAGSVVNILDTRIADRDPRHASYHLGKRGLWTATRDMAAAYAPDMRINAVAPGAILPPDEGDASWARKRDSAYLPGEWGNSNEVAEAVLYLTGARFVTGQIIFVDGGRHLKGNAYGL